MKKIISIFLFVAILCSFCVFADSTNIQVDIKSITDDIITVSGVASLDEVVTVYVLNPGKTEADANAESSVSNIDVYQFSEQLLQRLVNMPLILKSFHTVAVPVGNIKFVL